MYIITIAMLKGGVGKTTTAINLAAALHHAGKKILLVDADPQANLTQSLGISEEGDANLYTLLKSEINGESSDARAAIVQTESGLSIIPSAIDLAGAELELVSAYSREQMLSWVLEPIKNDYDYIFIDCPPSMGMLSVNALVASDYLLMPLTAEFLPLKGLRSFMTHFKTIKNTKARLNKQLDILGFVFTKYDERKTMNRQIAEAMREEFGERVFATTIRTNIQLAKAQEAGTDVFAFDKRSHGAEDYEALAQEFLKKMEE